MESPAFIRLGPRGELRTVTTRPSRLAPLLGASRRLAVFHACMVVCLIALPLMARGDCDSQPLILNEYNAVSSSSFLNGGDALSDDDGGLAGDVSLGRVAGNGGDWFEIVITENNCDFRNWLIEIYEEGDLDTTLELTQDVLWTQLQAGTILTVSEDQPEDVSYAPELDDWWINVRADSDASGTYITASSFPVNNDDWRIVIKDAEGVVRYGPAGEGIGGSGGVNSREIYKLEEDPSAFVLPTANCYDDSDTFSTFGQPNRWSDGLKIQNFEPLRTGSAPTSQCNESDLRAIGFEPDRLLEIEIVMSPADYELLRREQLSLMDAFGGQCGDSPAPNPYNFYPAEITVDGTTIPNAGVRKKGFFGSSSPTKPSFKIDFTEFGSEITVYGLERLTLNNLQQDPSLLDQCLGYGLFEKAGLVASRCNFAHVSVNGVSLGIYANVESIKEPFLLDNYGDASGKLYEGSAADFRPNWIDVIEKKNNDDVLDLYAIALALEIEDDAAALAALGDLIDLENFHTYWALSGLIGDWDGYPGNANNYWMYQNPTSGKYEFFPWSLDDIFGRDNPLAGGGAVARTYFDNAAISNRLWQIPEVRLIYQQRIEALVNTIWDETELLAEIDQMNALISPVAGDRTAAVEATRTWIQGRAAKVASDFANGPPSQVSNLPGKNCLEIQGAIEADFSTTYTDPIPFGLVPGSTLTINSFSLNGFGPLVGVTSLFGPSAEFGRDLSTLRLVGIDTLPFGMVLNIPIYDADIEANTPTPIVLGDTIASQLLRLNLSNTNLFPIGAVVNASMSFTEVGLNPGDPVSGSVSADLARWTPLPLPEPSGALSIGMGVVCLTLMARRRNRCGTKN